MKKVIWKFYQDFEKEELWLNKMCNNGYALVDYTWCRYVFIECEPQEYIYRIELLDHNWNSRKNDDYLQFLKESNIEHIASYGRWAYFRRKRQYGEFEIYSDTNSKIAYYKKVNNFWTGLAIMELCIGLSNLFGALRWHATEGYFSIFRFSLALLLIGFGVRFLKVGHSMRQHIKQLSKDKDIHE